MALDLRKKMLDKGISIRKLAKAVHVSQTWTQYVVSDKFKGAPARKKIAAYLDSLPDKAA